MKRIAVGILSLSMLAATSAQAYHDSMQGPARGDHYRRNRDESTWIGHRRTRRSFQMDYRERTSRRGRRGEHRANMHSHMDSGMSHHRTSPHYQEHMYRPDVVSREHRGWIGDRQEAYNGPGIGGQGDLDKQY